MKLREMAIAGRNLAMGGNLASLSLAGSPRAAVSYASECLFLKGCFGHDGLFRQRNVWEALGWNGALCPVIHPNAAGDWFRTIASFTADLVSLCLLCQITRPKVVFEIGTFHGSGTLHLAANAPEAQVYTLDLPPEGRGSLPVTIVDRAHIDEHAQTALFEGTAEAARITRLLGDSAAFDYSPWREQVDLFFVDGAHSYEYVKSDTLHALACCHAGSLLVWHDYGRFGVNGVSRWLHEFARQGHEIDRVPGGSLAYMKVGSFASAQGRSAS